jgi:hypothetical protein
MHALLSGPNGSPLLSSGTTPPSSPPWADLHLKLYWFPPRHFGLLAPTVTPVIDLNTWLDDCALMLSLIQQHLSRAQTRMKRQADKHHSERSFAIGTWVFLKLQPYKQGPCALEEASP